jgi:tagatose 1,6-diphosphate aldolase
MTELSAGKYWRMRRLADNKGLFKMMAIDQRVLIADPLAKRLGVAKATHRDIATFKEIVVETLAPHVSALLLDPYYGYPGAIHALPASCGLLTAVEDAPPRKDEVGGLYTNANPSWSVAKAVRAGSDAIKLLVFYRPDAPAAAREHQENLVRQVGAACMQHDVPHILEILDYPLATDAADQAKVDAAYGDRIIESIETFAGSEYGVDVFKMPAPVRKAPEAADKTAVRNAERAFERMAKACGRPWVLLSAGVADDEFYALLDLAYEAGASGFLAGRALWQRSIQAYPDADAMRATLRGQGLAYLTRINELTEMKALPWHRHACWDGHPRLADAGERFMSTYPEAVAY